MSNNDENGDAGAPRDRGYYLSRAYVNAFGVYDEPNWDPEQGLCRQSRSYRQAVRLLPTHNPLT